MARFKVPIVENGTRVWREMEEFDTSGAGVHATGRSDSLRGSWTAFCASTGNSGGPVGDAWCHLLSARELLRFSRPLMERVAGRSARGGQSAGVVEERLRSDRITAAGWRIVLLASLGGTLEFYDFVIFGIFARDIADAMFPNTSPLVSLMASFAAFAAGYLARPLGGIVLSHYGDRYGRRRVFLWSIFVMSGATLGMGLVPSYAQWGVAASALMVGCGWCRGSALAASFPAR